MLPYLVVAAVVIGLALALWLALGPGPRRRRAFTRAQRLLDSGDWKGALAALEPLRAGPGLSDAWQARLRNAEGEAHQLASDESLKARDFEDALRHALLAAPLLGVEEGEARTRVIELMLAEVRRLFAAGTDPDHTRAVLDLLGRVYALRGGDTPGPAEALFWQGLCQVRSGELEQALATLGKAHELVGRQVIDPALYVGFLLHRLGKPQEALRFLGEANRVDAGCPFVTWQMGISLVATGGDSMIALKALQRALGPRGLPLWLPTPERAWIEAFPEARSYVRRLASKYPFTCPLLGRDLPTIIRQGQLALAHAYYRQERFQEASDLFGKLLQESPPTPGLLRGYGLSLARLGQYDQAYKHLRIALEQEEPKDPFTAGYLALCGAMGKPTQADDKPRNVLWAVRLMARFPVNGNPEWAGLLSTVFAEARALKMDLGVEDQVLLCDTLASVQATDPKAASGYAHLAATFPDAVRPIYAWLYARAATEDVVPGPADLTLFAHTFRTRDSAREFFARQGWDFEEVEYTYLAHSAQQAPGKFPEALGPDYPPRGEAFLLARSEKEEAQGRKEQAKSCVEVLLRLAPQSLKGHDRLACLHYRGGDGERALALLGGWHRLDPADHWPLVRQAIIEQERGNSARRAEAIDRALGLTRGPVKVGVALLGAKLALREAVREWERQRKSAERTPKGRAAENGTSEDYLPGQPPAALGDSLRLLKTCLEGDPDHVEALWCLAAVRSALGDRDGLAEQAPRMNRPAVSDPRFHYLGAVCHLAARSYAQAVQLGQRVTELARSVGDEALAVESQYLVGLAHLHLDDAGSAQQVLAKVAGVEKSPSAVYARALLGRLSFARGAYDDAVRWWNMVDARRRAQWHLDDPLRQTVLLSGLLALKDERYEQAAERFREAGRLGLRDKRLGGLLTLALVKAGQRLLYQVASAPPAARAAQHDSGRVVLVPRRAGRAREG